jgi:hypothetical protein
MKAKIIIQLLGQNAIGRTYLYHDNYDKYFVRIQSLSPDNELSEIVALAEYLQDARGPAFDGLDLSDFQPGDDVEIADHATLFQSHYDGDMWVVSCPRRKSVAA